MSANNLIIVIFEILYCVIIVLFFVLCGKIAVDSEKELIDIGKRDEEIKTLKIKKPKKALRIVGDVVFGFFAVVFIGMSAWGIYSKYDRNAIRYSEYQIVSISTGSMSEVNEENSYLLEEGCDNQFGAGSLIVLQYQDLLVPENKPQIGDVYSYWLDDTLIVHRVYRIGILDDNGFQDVEDYKLANAYVFKGDANNIADSRIVELNQIHGKYIDMKVEGLGYVLEFISSELGLVSLLAILCIIYFSSNYNQSINDLIRNRKLLLESDQYLLSNANNPSASEEETQINYEDLLEDPYDQSNEPSLENSEEEKELLEGEVIENNSLQSEEEKEEIKEEDLEEINLSEENHIDEVNDDVEISNDYVEEPDLDSEIDHEEVNEENVNFVEDYDIPYSGEVKEEIEEEEIIEEPNFVIEDNLVEDKEKSSNEENKKEEVKETKNPTATIINNNEAGYVDRSKFNFSKEKDEQRKTKIMVSEEKEKLSPKEERKLNRERQKIARKYLK